FLTGAAAALAGFTAGAGRRASTFRATGLAAGFLALADLGAGRLAAISRSSKAVWLVKDAGLYRPTFACKRGGKGLQNQECRSWSAPPGAEPATFSSWEGNRRCRGPPDLAALCHDGRVDSAANIKARSQSHEPRMYASGEAIDDLVRYRLVKCAPVAER